MKTVRCVCVQLHKTGIGRQHNKLGAQANSIRTCTHIYMFVILLLITKENNDLYHIVLGIMI